MYIILSQDAKSSLRLQCIAGNASEVQGCQISFFDAKFNKFGVFKGRWRQKNCLAFLLFFLQYLAFFGGSSYMLSDWCLGFFINILLKSVIIISFLRQCFVYFRKLYLATHISHTQGSFNSVVVIVVNVQTCCLARYT